MANLSVFTKFKAVDLLSGKMRRMTASVRSFSKSARKQFDTANAAAQKMGGGLASAGKQLAALSVGGGAALVALGKAGFDFERNMSGVKAVMADKGTPKAMKALSDEAKRLGATTAFTAAEVAAGMETMARAGFDANQVIAGMGPVLSAAAAEGISIAEASSIVSNTLKGMNLEASQAGRVADVLALASARTNSTISSLGMSMKNVSATATNLGVNLEQTIAAVALLQDKGLDASEAGTAMSTMLNKLAAPSKAIKKEMSDLGVTFQDANGDMLDLPIVMKNIGVAMKANEGNLAKQAKLTEIFGLRGQKAAAMLTNLAESGDLEKLYADLLNASGAAKQMADTKLDNLAGDLTKLGSAIDGTKVALFEQNSGPLREFAQWLTFLATYRLPLIVDEVAHWKRQIIANKDEILKWINIIKNVVLVIGTYVVVMKSVAFGLAAWDVALKTLAFTTKIFGVAWKILSFTIGSTPIGLIITAIVALVAAIIYWWPEVKALWDKFAGWVAHVGRVIALAFFDAWDSVKEKWSAGMTWLRGVIDDFKYFANDVGTWIKGIWDKFVDGIKAYIGIYTRAFRFIRDKLAEFGITFGSEGGEVSAGEGDGGIGVSGGDSRVSVGGSAKLLVEGANGASASVAQPFPASSPFQVSTPATAGMNP